MSKMKKLGKPGVIEPGDKFPLEGKELTPLGEYLSAYSAMLFVQLSAVMAEAQAHTLTRAASSWDKFGSGIMYLLNLPAKAAKAVKGKPALTLTDHLTLLGLTMEDWNRLRWEKECRATWNKSEVAIFTQYGIRVGHMPESFPAFHKARIEAEAQAKAAQLVAEVTKGLEVAPVPEIAPLAAIAPSMALAIVPVSEALHEPRADSGELPTPSEPVTEAIAALDAKAETVAEASTEPVLEPTPTQPEAIASVTTPDAPSGGEVVPGSEALATEPCADSACTSCEPEPVSTEAGVVAEGPLPDGAPESGLASPEIMTSGPEAQTTGQEPGQEPVTDMATVAALAGALALVPSGETEPVDAPLGDGQRQEAEAIASDTGPEAVTAGGQAETGFVQVADVAPLVDASEAGASAEAEGEGVDPLPVAATESAVANEASAVAGDAGQLPTDQVQEPVGLATAETASAVESETEHTEADPGMGAVTGVAHFLAPGEAQADPLALVPSPEAVALANGPTVDASAAIGEVPSTDPFEALRAEIDAKLDIAWADHCEKPCEASARHVRAIARAALNEHPKVFSHQDLHKWRDRTRAYIPQTGQQGRKGHLSVAYTAAAVQEMGLTPQQEEAGAILAAARAISLGSGEANDNAVAAGVVLPDEGRPTGGVN